MLFIFLVFSFSWATIISVPSDQPTIQLGIDASSDGDTVLVQPDIYYENINFNGHNITLGSLFIMTGDTSYISQTVIDGSQNGTVVIFESGESSFSRITGFMIVNGSGTFFEEYIDIPGYWHSYMAGGAILCNNSSPIISYCNLSFNSTDRGGGVHCRESTAEILYCSIHSNTADTGGGINGDNSYLFINCNLIEDNIGYLGGGIYLSSSLETGSLIHGNVINNNYADHGAGICIDWLNINFTISENIIASNTADMGGGGIYCVDSSPKIIGNLIVYNEGQNWNGGGIRGTRSSARIINNTLNGNSCGGPGAGDIHMGDYMIGLSGQITNNIITNSAGMIGMSCCWSQYIVAYNNFWSNENNPSQLPDDFPNYFFDPFYVDLDNGDYHLQSDSPCIDSGDPDLDGDGITWEEDPDDQDPDGTRMDMGAFYYNQGPCPGWIMGDPNQDGAVDILDVVISVICVIAGCWDDYCFHWTMDIDADGTITILDIVTMVDMIMGE